MRITKEVEEINVILDDVICNKCGGSLKRGYKDHPNFYGIVEYAYCGGYFSGNHPGAFKSKKSKINDCDFHVFSICEGCLSEIIETFKIPPSHYANHSELRRDASLPYPNNKELKQIQIATTQSELATYLVDPDEVVKKYAEVRLKQLEENK